MPGDAKAAVDQARGAGPKLAPDAAIVLGIASTAMPFADGLEGEAERWLRVLRLYGESGALLQALGVSEMALAELDEPAEHQPRDLDAGRDTVGWVSTRAVQIAGERGAAVVGTLDVLEAVMYVYGTDFDHVLHTHGTDRAEVVERLPPTRS